jgi:hypothetical protein
MARRICPGSKNRPGDELQRLRSNCTVQIIELKSFMHPGKRGTPKAMLLGIRDYLRLAAPEPEVLRVLGEESRRKGTDKLTSRQIDEEIKAARAVKRKRG